MIRKSKKAAVILMAFLMAMALLTVARPINLAAASAKSNIYLVLVEEKDGTWCSYDDYVEVISADKLMVRAFDLAEAIGVQYKKTSAKNFTISNDKKVNTYTLGSSKYKYLNNGKSATKVATYKAFLSDTYHTNMVDYNTLKTLVNVKYFKETEAKDYYKKLKYQGVICFSKYNKITALPPLEEGTRVTTQDEFKKAVADLKTSVINIAADITLSEDFTSNREEKEVIINIKKGKTLTIDQSFLAVGGSIINDGNIIVNGSFERGICNLINNGSIVINNKGMTTAGMSDMNNYGMLTVNNGAELYVEKGSQLYNYGNLNNDGLICIDNGGSVHDKGGKIINNGIIDLHSYFNGDITLITGSGKLNDYREAVSE